MPGWGGAVATALRHDAGLIPAGDFDQADAIPRRRAALTFFLGEAPPGMRDLAFREVGGEGQQTAHGNQPAVLTFALRIVLACPEAIMRHVTLLAISVAMLVSPAFAQTPRDTNARPSPPETSRAVSGQSPSSASQAGSTSESPRPPLDQGPVSPEANQAHRGGGAVLEGAPGAPAPLPQPTPSHDASPRH